MAACAYSQDQSFNVASIKPNPNPRGRPKIEVTPGGLTITPASLSYLIQWAYNIRRDQIVSPPWTRGEFYDIAAKTSAPSTEDQIRVMLQSLLAERFQLAYHRESRMLSVYQMVVAKSGSKLVESKSGEGSNPRTTRISYPLPHTSMAELALKLQELGAVSLPVVDRTGLTGYFDITLTFPEGSRPTDRPGGGNEADIFSILEKQLGLKLEEKKSATEVLVVDRAERPTGN